LYYVYIYEKKGNAKIRAFYLNKKT